MLSWVEGDRRATKLEIFEFAARYQSEWRQKLRDPEKWGIKEENVVPHPDDIVLDYETGDVTFTGPITIEQRDAQDQLIAMRAPIEANIKRLERKVERQPGDAGAISFRRNPARRCLTTVRP